LKLQSIQSRRKYIAVALQQCRQNTLNLLAEIDDLTFSQQAHPDFSPIGWHFGHIAFIEAYWILEHLANSIPIFPEYHRLFAADGLPKQERQNLPNPQTIQNYLNTVREQVLNYLVTAPLEIQERLWQWLIQHESQHTETITFLLQLHRQQQNSISSVVDFTTAQSKSISSLNRQEIAVGLSDLDEMIEVKAGEFIMGSDALDALDNESPAHKIHLNTYWIDRYPVTCQQYRQFMASGGYQNRKYWSDQGWHWLQINPVSQPLYWLDSPDWHDHPVCGISYYEAEAYANFVGKRLPTEVEWAKAAIRNPVEATSLRCNHSNAIGHTTPVNAYPENQSIYGAQDMLGNVWEWTACWFDGYKNFVSYPYPGYSQAYFDHQHRVLRGGSWATNPWVLRTSFRNWYNPGVRQILAGFRCAID